MENPIIALPTEPDWNVALLFPERIRVPGLYPDAVRRKFDVSRVNGETVAYYDYIEECAHYWRKTTTFLYGIRGGQPFLIERFETRFRKY